MNFPSISVIIPTYRREEPLKDTLDDLLKQDYPNFEVLVIDQTATHSH
jgi:glycosyltransferase involved in cell wall biosynthesis